MGEPKIDTKTRILETAERLFAVHGADKTTLRQISSLAGVNLAAVNYHFGSKAELISALLSRVLDPVLERQIAMLEDVETRGGDGLPDLEGIIRAFITPAFEFSRSGFDKHSFFENLFRADGDEMRFKSQISRSLAKIHRHFLPALQRALPGRPVRNIYFRYIYLWTACHIVMEPVLLDGVQEIFGVDLEPLDDMLEDLIAYHLAGFQSL